MSPPLTLGGPALRCARVRRVVVIVSLFAALSGCQHDPSGEARMFLDRLDGLDLDDPIEDRRRLVENLAHMPLTDDDVREARDVCVEAHRTLISAEDLHARARAALAGHEDETTIPIPERQRIQSDIDGSNRALERAAGLVSRCERHTRDLDMRYRRHR